MDSHIINFMHIDFFAQMEVNFPIQSRQAVDSSLLKPQISPTIMSITKSSIVGNFQHTFPHKRGSKIMSSSGFCRLRRGFPNFF